MQHRQEAKIKQWLIAKTLRIREQFTLIFARGDYQPLAVEGEYADQVVAFARRYEHKFLIVVAPRLCANLLGDSAIPFVNPAAWGETRVLLPDEWSAHRVLLEALAAVDETNRSHSFLVSDLLARGPVNFLVFDTTDSQDHALNLQSTH